MEEVFYACPLIVAKAIGLAIRMYDCSHSTRLIWGSHLVSSKYVYISDCTVGLYRDRVDSCEV